MDFVIGVLVVAVGLILSIALHELGHLVPAKLFKVKVAQYFVGFGKSLFSVHRGGTEYGVKMLPLGGYVRIIGMFPPNASKPAAAEQPTRGIRKTIATIVEDTRAASQADIDQEIAPGEGVKPFYELTTPRKLAVMFGGPVVNLIIAIVLFAIVLTCFGQAMPSNKLGTVASCVVPAGENRDCTGTDPASPASLAGLEPSDTIISWNGHQVNNWEDLTAQIAASGTAEVPVEVLRDGHRLELSVTPELEPRPSVKDGQIVTGENGSPVLTEQPYVGVGPTYQLYKQPASAVLPYTWNILGATTNMVITLPQRLVSIAESTFGSQPRDPGVMGLIGVGRVAGEIASVHIDNYGTTERAADLLSLLGSLNMALFVFNMVPLLPLDGGHIVGALYEGARRRIAAMRKRKDPGHVDTAKLMPLTYVVFAVLIGMSVLLAFADIFNPITLT